MIVVTGGAGFIGSNIVHALNGRGLDDVVVVDDLTDTRKVANIADARFEDYLDRGEFLRRVEADDAEIARATLIIHQGATSSTTVSDGRAVMENNYEYSKRLVEFCLRQRIPLIYASSAAVYGRSTVWRESPENEVPANVYGLSKLMVDNHVRRALPTAGSQLVGLRYFNVYGEREDHKDEMASVAAQLDDELRAHGTATIFGASHGVGPGQQRRDFVAVTDVVDVVLWFADHPDRSGIFNVGTGVDRSFREVAEAVIAHRGSGERRFREFPAELHDRYQPLTTADLGALRAIGYSAGFTPIEVGIPRYLEARDRRRAADRS